MQPIEHAYVEVDGRRVYLDDEDERFISDQIHGRPCRMDDGTMQIIKPWPPSGGPHSLTA